MSKRVFDFIPGAESDEIDGNVIESALVITKSDDYTITDTDGGGTFIQTGADKTFTLPTAADNTDRKLSFVNAGSGYLDIAAEGSENINDTLSSYRLSSQYSGAVFYCDGTGWYVFEEINSMLNVSNKTADYTITASEAKGNYIFTNAGASEAITFTLPTASAGLSVVIAVMENQSVSIEPNTDDDINSSALSNLNQIVTTDVGFTNKIYSINSTNWFLDDTLYWSAVKGIFCGGEQSASPAKVDILDYIYISKESSASDYGDLISATILLAGCASSTRGVFGGGSSTSTSYEDTIQYITISANGNSQNFGDLTLGVNGLASLSNSTRGLFGGGQDGAYRNIVSYIEISSLSNSSDFGDLHTGISNLAGCSSSTIGLFGGGITAGGHVNNVSYFTLSSEGNYTDFGDLSGTTSQLAACSNSTRALFGGGSRPTYINVVEYFTFSSEGNYTDFGDLSSTNYSLAGCSSSIRALFGGGGSGTRETIEFFTFSTTSNYTDFGDLSVGRQRLAGCSNGHGGLL